jgi:glycosyltransferase involved in cell wall biosynthesis
MTSSINDSLSVCMWASSSQLGGAERMLLNAIDSIEQTPKLSSISFSCILLTHGPLEEELRSRGIPFHILDVSQEILSIGESDWNHTLLSLLRRIPLFLRNFLVEWPRMLAFLKKHRVTMIHSHGIKCHILTALLPSSLYKIWHLHDFISRRKITSHLLPLFSGRIHSALAISNAVRSDAVSILSKPTIHVIENAINTHVFTPQNKHLFSLPQPFSDTSKLRIGFFATYARWKGHHVFIEAIHKLIQNYPSAPNIQCFIVGGAVYTTQGSQWTEEILQSDISSRGLQNYITLIPFQLHPEKWMAHMDVIVHASTEPEPFGLTIVEAMASQVPVIISSHGGAKEIITHNVDGIHSPPSDPIQLSQALFILLIDSKHRQKIASHARQTAEERFSLVRYGRELSLFYQSRKSSP